MNLEEATLEDIALELKARPCEYVLIAIEERQYGTALLSYSTSPVKAVSTMVLAAEFLEFLKEQENDPENH